MGIGKRRAGRGGGQWAVQGESGVTFLFAARVERWTLILMEGTGRETVGMGPRAFRDYLTYCVQTAVTF